MAESHVHSHDPVGQTLGRAVWVFAALGLTQIIAALLTHKVALGADGGHNLLEFLILGISRWAHGHERDDDQNFWNCRVAPRAPEITSYGTIVATLIFLILSLGQEQRRGVWLALALVLTSVMVNGLFAANLHNHRHTGVNAHASWSHLAGDTLASVLAALAYLAIGLGASLIWDPVAAGLGALVVVLVHIKPIRLGRASARYHRQADHSH